MVITLLAIALVNAAFRRKQKQFSLDLKNRNYQRILSSSSTATARSSMQATNESHMTGLSYRQTSKTPGIEKNPIYSHKVISKFGRDLDNTNTPQQISLKNTSRIKEHYPQEEAIILNSGHPNHYTSSTDDHHDAKISVQSATSEPSKSILKKRDHEITSYGGETVHDQIEMNSLFNNNTSFEINADGHHVAFDENFRTEFETSSKRKSNHEIRNNIDSNNQGNSSQFSIRLHKRAKSSESKSLKTRPEVKPEKKFRESIPKKKASFETPKRKRDNEDDSKLQDNIEIPEDMLPEQGWITPQSQLLNKKVKLSNKTVLSTPLKRERIKIPSKSNSTKTYAGIGGNKLFKELDPQTIDIRAIQRMIDSGMTQPLQNNVQDAKIDGEKVQGLLDGVKKDLGLISTTVGDKGISI